MIEQTVFENIEEIKEYVKNKYGFTFKNVKKIKRGSANIYNLDNDKYILKEFQSKYSKEEIDKEIEVINHLKKHRIKVPIYIKTKGGNYSDVYKEKVIIIQKFIKGNVLGNNCGDYEQTIECAKVYGKIVKALKTLPIELSSSDLSGWYSKESFDMSIKKHQKLLNMIDENDKEDLKIKKDILDKIDMIKDIKDRVDFNGMNNLTVENTHGDYNVMQFIYKDKHINAVIDFVSACKMPIAWELIRSYSYIDKKAKDGDFDLNNFIDYVKEFNKYVKLNEYDIKYMSYIYLVQILNSTFGYKQYLMDRTKKDLLKFGYLRTNICRYLYNNADIISNRLEEEL